MHNKTNFLRGWLLLAGGLACAHAWGYTFMINEDTGLPLRWRESPIKLQIMLGADKTLLDGTTYNSSAQAAATAWNTEIGSTQFQATTAAAGPATDNNSLNELVFAAKVFDRDFEAEIIAVTTAWHLGNRRVEGDIIFNSATRWDSYRGAVRTDGLEDLRRVALHELGHLLGLGHPDQAGEPSSGVMNSRVSDVDALTVTDKATAQVLYGGPGGVPANDNFNSAITATVVDGTYQSLSTTASATKEPGEPDHAGNVGGHSIWWIWKAPTYGDITMDTKGSYSDTLLAVYTGNTLTGLTSVASNDDIEQGKVQASTVTFRVTRNQVYRIAVDGFKSTDDKTADSSQVTLNFKFTAASGDGPMISSHPASLTVQAGGNATFTVAATGAGPLSYQWYFNGAAISGATSSSYSVSNVQAAQAGTYTVIVSNAIGSSSSEGASLGIQTPPPPPPPPPPSSGGGGGGGGGGGAPSTWFIAALATLSLGRWLQRRRA